MRRAPERLGYWSLVSGGVEPDETPSRRRRAGSSREETGLERRCARCRSRSRTRSSTILRRSARATRRGSSASPSTRSSRTRRRAGSRPSTPSTTSIAGATCDEARRALMEYETARVTRLRAARGSAVRVGVDTSPLVQTRAGTARHVRGLLGALRERPGHRPRAARRSAAPGGSSSVVRDALWYPLGLRRRARGLDVLHCTTFRGPVGTRVPTVAHRARPRDPARTRRRSLAGIASTDARGSRACCGRPTRSSPSPSSRDARRPSSSRACPPERIRVVPNGVDRALHAGRPARGGRLRARGRDARAAQEPRPCRRCGRASAGVELRVVGARGWGGVDVPGWVGEMPDAELAALYRGARCVVYPSLYEGFGLPVLEAMACGTPVVTSRGTAMEEVAGSAAVLVDPLDVVRDRGGDPRGGLRAATSSSPPASRARASSPGSAPPTRSSTLWRELA